MHLGASALSRKGPRRVYACIHAEVADAVPMTSPIDESQLTSLKKKLSGRHSDTKEL